MSGTETETRVWLAERRSRVESSRHRFFSLSLPRGLGEIELLAGRQLLGAVRDGCEKGLQQASLQGREADPMRQWRHSRRCLSDTPTHTHSQRA